MILTQDQFMKKRGCPNCNQQIYDYEALREFTTTNFCGMIAVMGATNAQSSWVCKWNKLRRAKPGIYAINSRQEVTMINEYDDGEEDGSADGYENSERDTERDEREINIKRETIMNRW